MLGYLRDHQPITPDSCIPDLGIGMEAELLKVLENGPTKIRECGKPEFLHQIIQVEEGMDQILLFRPFAKDAEGDLSIFLDHQVLR